MELRAGLLQIETRVFFATPLHRSSGSSSALKTDAAIFEMFALSPASSSLQPYLLWLISQIMTLVYLAVPPLDSSRTQPMAQSQHNKYLLNEHVDG